jgi:hypothetical protein
MLQHTRRTNAVVRRVATLAVLAAIAVGLPGCLAIKSQTTSQRAPGVVTLDLVVCATDRNRQIDSDPNEPPPPVPYPDCDPDGSDGTPQNTAEGTNTQDMEDFKSRAQILIGYRVPVGSEGPQSFASDAGDMTFNRSPTYEAELNSPADEGGFPAPEGFRWVGYISNARNFDLVNDASSRSVRARAEFTLPPQAGGAPFAGSFPWRPVVGVRQIGNESDAGQPVECSGGNASGTICVDSPRTDRVPINLVATVSDFGVLAGAKASVGQEETATVNFPIQYTDVAGLGPRELALTATTNVPSTGTSLVAPTVTVAPNSSETVAVQVRVPAGTRLGSYTVTLSAATGTPAVTRSNTATIEVVDKIAPTVQIGTPTQGQTFALGQKVNADYACGEELNGSGVKSCSGPVAPGAALDTRTPGEKTFTVTATDSAGNTATITRSYTVIAPRVSSGITHAWLWFARHTLVTKLLVTGIPKGATLTIKCGKGGKKAGCPFSKKRVSVPKGGKKSLVSLFNKKKRGSNRARRSKLRVGVVLQIQINARGHVGKVVNFKIRKNDQPADSVLCTKPGTTTPLKVC